MTETRISAVWRRWWRQRWQRWLDGRLPSCDELHLDHRNVFVFPTDVGFAYGVVCVLVFLCGVNYANSLVLGLSFLMLSVGVVSIHLTFFSLAGAVLSARRVSHAFVGEYGSMTLRVTAGTHDLPAVRLTLKDTHTVSVQSGEWAELVLSVPVVRRGHNAIGRILIETTWPFSLVRCWTWWSPSMDVLGYPVPELHDGQTGSGGCADEGAVSRFRDESSPDDLRSYRTGDPLTRVVWRVSLRSGELYVRDGEGVIGQAETVDVSLMPGPGTERRYAQAAFSVISRLSAGLPTGLVTPAGTVLPAEGNEHLERCLILLALSEE